MRFSLGLVTLFLLIGTGIVFYLSWLPDPALSKYGFLPDWLARWTDAEVNDKLRTGVPLLFLGFFTGFLLSLTKKGWKWWVAALVGLVSIVLIAELGQLLLPHRSFDWGDVVWGSIGSLSGLGVAAVSFQVIQVALKQTREQPQSSSGNT
ncbi:VanZ family protein [Spirosoma areae]